MSWENITCKFWRIWTLWNKYKETGISDETANYNKIGLENQEKGKMDILKNPLNMCQNLNKSKDKFYWNF